LLRSVFFWTAIFSFTVAMLPMVVLSLPFNKEGRVIRFYANIWGKLNLFTSGVNLEVKGLENIIRNKPQVFVSNHQSIYDIFALCTLPVYFRWIAKKELFRVPVFGWLMMMAGCVSIDRSDFHKALSGMDIAANKAKSGASIMIFPEGTRSQNGILLPFKKGGFILALKAKIPILPITIIGSSSIMQKGSMRVNPGHIKIIIDRPVETINLGFEDRDSLVRRVREIISRNLFRGLRGRNGAVNL